MRPVYLFVLLLAMVTAAIAQPPAPPTPTPPGPVVPTPVVPTPTPKPVPVVPVSSGPVAMICDQSGNTILTGIAAPIGRLYVLSSSGSSGQSLSWDVIPPERAATDALDCLDPVSGARLLALVPSSSGTVWITLNAVTDSQRAKETITVNPGPPPTPTPTPGPGPGPTPTPVASKIRVLMIWPFSSMDQLPEAQAAISFSAKIRSYLNTHCVVDASGPAKRQFDAAVDMSKETADWQTLFAKVPVSPTNAAVKTAPYIVIQGDSSFNGAMPADEDATLALLQQYGGP